MMMPGRISNTSVAALSIVFATATRRWDKVQATDRLVDVVGYVAAKLTAQAVVRSVKLAKPMGGVPSRA